MSSTAAHSAPAGSVLGPNDPPPFELVNEGGSARFLLICDHASNAIPPTLGTLGLEEAARRRHIAVDIGAGDLTRRLAERLDAPAVVAAYSRLVIDNNRYLNDPTSIPEISDGTIVPGNRDLSAHNVAIRAREIFHPYHAAIDRALADLGSGGRVPALISIHSFTPFFRGVERPWHVGLLWSRDRRIAEPLLESLSSNRGVVVGENVPYSARDPYGCSNVEHADAHGLPNILIEIRQDLVDTRHGVATWANILGVGLSCALADDRLYERGDT